MKIEKKTIEIKTTDGEKIYLITSPAGEKPAGVEITDDNLPKILNAA